MRRLEEISFVWRGDVGKGKGQKDMTDVFGEEALRLMRNKEWFNRTMA